MILIILRLVNGGPPTGAAPSLGPAGPGRHCHGHGVQLEYSHGATVTDSADPGPAQCHSDHDGDCGGS